MNFNYQPVFLVNLAPNPFRIRTSAKLACKPFRICTSKTKDLKSFRIRTYKKTRGRGCYGQPEIRRRISVPSDSSGARDLSALGATRSIFLFTNHYPLRHGACLLSVTASSSNSSAIRLSSFDLQPLPTHYSLSTIHYPLFTTAWDMLPLASTIATSGAS